MIIRVVDFETTGLPTDEGGAAICEVGWCDVHTVIADPTTGLTQAVVTPEGAVSFLVNPGRPMPAVARAVHHIGDADVADSPPVETGLLHLADGAHAIYAAHNAAFEQEFFGGGELKWICTYKVALRLWPDAPSHSNQVLRYFLDLELPDADLAHPPHRAGPDAYVTAYLLAHMINDGRASIEDMVRWSSGPALLPKITFGKHKGSRWEDVPADYLQWIADKSDLDSDVKANARHHLKKRAAAA